MGPPLKLNELHAFSIALHSQEVGKWSPEASAQSFRSHIKKLLIPIPFLTPGNVGNGYCCIKVSPFHLCLLMTVILKKMTPAS